MTDDLDIRRGGAVAVDTATLRGVAHRLDVLGARTADAAHGVRSAAGMFHRVEAITLDYSDAILADIADAIERAAADAGDLARRLRSTAAVYETIELRSERDAALASGDAAAVARIDGRLAAIAGEHPWAGPIAWLDTAWWRTTGAADLLGQSLWISPFLPLGALWAPMAVFATGSALTSRGGVIPATSRLGGSPVAVTVTPIAGAPSALAPVTAPAGLAAAAHRIPVGEARVRVERYTMPDGTREWAVYIAGTEGAGDAAFDWGSNLDLYGGDHSASYDATVEALRQAGAQPGDTVHAIGHSQGAMIGARLSLEGGYDVQTLVSLGSPVEAAVPDSTLSVNLRHTDDPVAALADLGSAAGVGSAASFVAERAADPFGGVHDLGMPAHALEAYTETAALLDASTDPRMGEVRDVFAHLATAASVDVTEYSATRAED